MIDGISWGRKKLINRILIENFGENAAKTKKFNYMELLYVIQELLDEEGKKYQERGISKRGHHIFKEFVKYLLYRNIANYDSMILVTSVKGCLFEETIIKTKIYGNISLKNLVEKKKDFTPYLYSCDLKNDNKKVESFGQIIDSGIQDCYKIILKSGKEIVATAKHPFFIKDKNGKIKEIKLRDLKPKDKIIGIKELMYFEEIERIEFVGKKKTYDMHVPEYNNFLLGNDVLTHNTGKSSAAIMMAKEWCRLLGIRFDPKRHIAYNNADLMDKIDKLNKFEPIICLTGDTKIKLKENNKIVYRRIDELINKKNFDIYTYNIEKNRQEIEKAEKCVFNGIHDVYEIELENGQKIKATKNHLFLTHNGYKKLKDLKENDELVVDGEKKCDICGKFFTNFKKLTTCSGECNKEKKRLYLKKWNKENKEYAREKKRIYILEHKTEIKEKNRKWYEKNPVYVQNKNREYWKNNKKDLSIKHKIYIENNREKINKMQLKNHYRKQNSSSDYKIKRACRSRMYHALKRKGVTKNVTSVELIGCSYSFLSEYLEKQFDKNMTWENYGKYWVIDHIEACFKFNSNNIEERNKCFHYTNLRPLEAIRNSQLGGLDYYKYKNENKKN